MRARSAVLLVIAAVAAFATACSSSGGSSASGGSTASGSVPVASAGFTESRVLAQMYSALLKKAGFSSSVTDVSSSEIFQSSLEKGTIVVVPEYVATYADQLNKLIHGASAPSVASPSLPASLAALKSLAQQKGLSVLQPAKAVDQNAFAVSKSFASAHNLTTLSDLGKSGVSVTIAAGAECKTRPFCQPGLERTYGIKVKKIDPLGVDTTQSKTAVKNGKDQLALVLTTDATVPDFGLVTLVDDKHLQNADYLVPVVNAKALQAHPQIATALNPLASVLTTLDLAQMDKKVDSERQQPADVAKAYLQSKGLL
ncbi:MAG: ABC transporter substrate-binding protein [Actinomycetes bacterium]